MPLPGRVTYGMSQWSVDTTGIPSACASRITVGAPPSLPAVTVHDARVQEDVTGFELRHATCVVDEAEQAHAVVEPVRTDVRTRAGVPAVRHGVVADHPKLEVTTLVAQLPRGLERVQDSFARRSGPRRRSPLARRARPAGTKAESLERERHALDHRLLGRAPVGDQLVPEVGALRQEEVSCSKSSSRRAGQFGGSESSWIHHHHHGGDGRGDVVAQGGVDERDAEAALQLERATPPGRSRRGAGGVAAAQHALGPGQVAVGVRVPAQPRRGCVRSRRPGPAPRAEAGGGSRHAETRRRGPLGASARLVGVEVALEHRRDCSTYGLGPGVRVRQMGANRRRAAR